MDVLNKVLRRKGGGKDSIRMETVKITGLDRPSLGIHTSTSPGSTGVDDRTSSPGWRHTFSFFFVVRFFFF